MGICSGKGFLLLILQILSQVTEPSKGFKGQVLCSMCSFEEMFLSLVLSNWRGEKGCFFSLLPCAALNSLHLLFPHMLQPNLCRGKLHGAVGYFKWLFLCFVQVKEEKKKRKSSQPACVGVDLGWDFSGAGETWANVVEDTGSQVCLCFLLSLWSTWSVVTCFWDMQKNFFSSADLWVCVWPLLG